MMPSKNACFFTVIMAVYNVQPYLRDAIESIIKQDIGFNHVQLILVNDGSSDGSETICDYYGRRYKNVMVMHQSNQGVSAARNAALPYALGQYVNFMDADDRLSKNTLSAVWNFYEQHYGEVDVVSIPIFFFEGKEGPHPLNYKFEQGSRVIDLCNEWDAVQLSMSSSFIKCNSLEGVSFNTELRYGEDTELLLQILIKNPFLGVVSDGKYLYRQRVQGEQSAIQRSKTDPDRYLTKIKYLTEATIERCEKLFDAVPKFVQYTLMYDLQWIIQMGELPKGILSKKDEQCYLKRVYSAICSFDDEIILQQRNLDNEYKAFLLQKKHRATAKTVMTENDIQVYYDRCCVGSLTKTKITIEFVHIYDGKLYVEGCYWLYPNVDLPIKVFAENEGALIFADPKPAYNTRTAFGETLLRAYGFQLTIPIIKEKLPMTIQLGMQAMTVSVYFVPDYGWYSPVARTYRNGYYVKESLCLQAEKTRLILKSVTSTDKTVLEIKYLWELLADRHHHQRKAALIRILYWVIKTFKKKPIWMVSDRRISAGDNGEAFFRYLRKNHPEIDARFVLRKESSSFSALSSIGTVIENGRLKEKLTALMSDYILSSQGELQYINPMYKTRSAFRDIMSNKPFIFLQHGIIKHDLSAWLMKSNKNFYGFVTSAESEYRSILYGKYGYSEQQIWLTGLPRYDYLRRESDPRQITIMPTWRRYLMEEPRDIDMLHSLGSDFLKSEFFIFYHELLTNKTLIDLARKRGYQIAFLPHPQMQPHVKAFADCEEITVYGIGADYRKIYENSALVVTDYSSAVFDAAYLQCPVIYTQFDKEKFFSGEQGYQKGYFDDERDGFGEVEYTLEGTVARIVEYMEAGCKMKEKYQKRAEQYFAYRDQKNCQRVFDKIMENHPW